MKRLRRHAHCLNCRTDFPEATNFCPNCGQANTDNRVSLGELWQDVFSNYISLDSRLGHTLVPFLFSPGKLTVDFNAGKRIHYVHPVKLYLIVSVLFFFAFNHLVMPEVNQQLSDWQAELEETAYAKDTTQVMDSVKIEGAINLQLNGESNDLAKFYELATRRNVSTEEFMDSLDVETDLPFMNLIVKQTQKIFRNDASLFISTVIQNTPLVLLLLIPFFALLIHLLHFTKGRFYVEHLILAFHWQSFLYVLLISMVLAYAVGVFSGVGLIMLYGAYYSLLMFRRVYEQTWFLVVLKTSFLGFMYHVVFLFALIFNAMVSFLLF